MSAGSRLVVGGAAGRGRAPRMVGAALAATTGLLGLYAGNPRLPRAYAATTCTVSNNSPDKNDPNSLPWALVQAQAGTCDTINITATDPLTLTEDLPPIDFQTTTITSLTINSNSNFSVDANNNYRGLYVTDDKGAARKNVAIDGLKIREAHNYFVAHLTITDSRFEGANNSAEGGAVYAYGDATITNTTFKDNYSSGNYGGGLWVLGKATIDKGTFEGNYVGEYGGALYAKGGVEITESTFTSNTAGSYGGAIHTGYYTGTDSITGSTFDNNYAGCYAGAMSSGKEATNTQLIIATSTFKNNTSGCAAGAVWLNDGSATITNSTFQDNESGDTGGALYLRDYDADTGRNNTITGSNFTGNYADGHAGAVYSYSNKTEISGSTFTDNSASGNFGGAVYTDFDLTIDNSTFTNNRSYTGGGAVYVDAGDTTISSSTFSGNYTVTTNPDGPSGGAVFFGNGGGDPQQPLPLRTIQNSTFDSNRTGGDGGAIEIYSGALTVNFSTFVNNEADSGQSIARYPGMSEMPSTVAINGSVLSAPDGDNCKDVADSVAYSVVANTAGDDTSCGAAAPGGVTLATIAATNLGPLANNGGPTQTMLPGTGSVLIEGAPDGLGTGITTDQRGVARTGKFTVGSVQVPANTGPTGLMVRWVPWNIMSRWNPVPGATKYRNTLTLQPRGGRASTRTATTNKTQWQWPVKPAPRTPYTVCVSAYKSGTWSTQTCKSSTVGTVGWRSAGKALPLLTGTVKRAIR